MAYRDRFLDQARMGMAPLQGIGGGIMGDPRMQAQQRFHSERQRDARMQAQQMQAFQAQEAAQMQQARPLSTGLGRGGYESMQQMMGPAVMPQRPRQSSIFQQLQQAQMQQRQLPPGIDPKAVAADPLGWQRHQAMRRQHVMRPGEMPGLGQGLGGRGGFRGHEIERERLRAEQMQAAPRQQGQGLLERIAAQTPEQKLQSQIHALTRGFRGPNAEEQARANQLQTELDSMRSSTSVPDIQEPFPRDGAYTLGGGTLGGGDADFYGDQMGGQRGLPPQFGPGLGGGMMRDMRFFEKQLPSPWAGGYGGGGMQQQPSPWGGGMQQQPSPWGGGFRGGPGKGRPQPPPFLPPGGPGKGRPQPPRFPGRPGKGGGGGWSPGPMPGRSYTPPSMPWNYGQMNYTPQRFAGYGVPSGMDDVLNPPRVYPQPQPEPHILEPEPAPDLPPVQGPGPTGPYYPGPQPGPGRPYPGGPGKGASSRPRTTGGIMGGYRGSPGKANGGIVSAYRQR